MYRDIYEYQVQYFEFDNTGMLLHLRIEMQRRVQNVATK